MNKKVFPQLGEQYFEQRLENGMMVRVVEKPGFAKKYAFVAVNFGSIDTKFRLNGVDYATPDGVAHYLEHKMFDLPEGNAMELFAQNAGSNNAFTSYAMTAYYVECTEHFEENLSILLRLVTTPYFTEESVEKERGIIAQEIKMYDDSDRGRGLSGRAGQRRKRGAGESVPRDVSASSGARVGGGNGGEYSGHHGEDAL